MGALILEDERRVLREGRGRLAGGKIGDLKAADDGVVASALAVAVLVLLGESGSSKVLGILGRGEGCKC